VHVDEGEIGGEVITLGGVLDPDRGGDLHPEERVFTVALAASSMSWRSVIPERDMSNWWWSASEGLRTSKRILGRVGDSRMVFRVRDWVLLGSEELLVPGVMNARLPKVWMSMR